MGCRRIGVGGLPQPLFIVVTSAGDFLTLPLFSSGSFGPIYAVFVAFVVLAELVDVAVVAGAC